MEIYKYFFFLYAIFFLTAESRQLFPHKRISQVSPDHNAEKAGVPDGEILDFEFPPEPSNSRHIEVSPDLNAEKAVVPEEEILDLELPPEPLNSRHVEVSPDPNAEKAVVPEEEILDFDLPPEPSNSRHVEVSPDLNAEIAVVPEEEILDFELPPEPSNSRHVEIFVSAESQPLQPQNARELVERSESMKGGETKEISEAANSKGPLDPVWHDPRHNKMNP